MRREIITWSIVLAVILGAFGGTVLILNASLYSASGFVRSYLDALARHDADGALELAGAHSREGDPSDELLVPAAMAELGDIRLVSDSADADGVHHVVYSYEVGGVAGMSAFDVRQEGAVLGLFTEWAFADDPLGIIQLTVAHDDEFTANGLDLVTPEPGVAAPYLVFAPGTFEISHDSTFLHADPITVTSTEPGIPVAAQLDVQPNDAMIEQVQKEIDAYLLDECTTQQVLMPTGCPFGHPISNRVDSAPQWSMVEYPEVTLKPGQEPESWLMPSTRGVAHLVVDVKSIFDGSVSTFDEDVPFTASYLVTFLPDDELLITAQY